MTVEVILDDPEWEKAVAEPEDICRRAVSTAAQMAPAPAGFNAEVALLLTGDDRMRGLNARFRGRDKATNVLSFPSLEDPHCDARDPDSPVHLGDIAIARETVEREAAAAGKAMGDHLAHMAVHGFLHLLGYDHLADGEAEAMEALERRILARLDIADPY